jgi:saccharopine dehydrogenase (NAD+, L-glutamate forming)
MAGDRSHDIVVFGATGFTGELTAHYLAQNAPDGLSWALAGRNQGKLEAVRGRLAQANPACADLPLLTADAGDQSSLDEVAQGARVIITTVGPYTLYGEPLVKACAEAGTAYVDLTGEPEFVDLMYVRHHARAAETGARIIHSCGFDSIPHDLGAYFTVKQLPEGVPLKVEGYVTVNGTFSGGTLASAMTGMSRLAETRRAAAERKRIEPRPEGRRVRAVPGRPHRVAGIGWAVPMPTIDPAMVARSARAVDRYGPDFTYSHYFASTLPRVLGGAVGMGAVVGLAQIPAARRFIAGRRAPGEGPSEAERAKSWFKVHFFGEGGGERVHTEVSGGDPGYGETAKMLGESALCLALDDLPATAGQVTTAHAMGDALIARLDAGGITFRVV